MDTKQFRILDYRRMMQNGVTPLPREMAGQWRGVNKGIVQIAGYGQFIKSIQTNGDGVVHGDNLQVNQVPANLARSRGWSPKLNFDGSVAHRGKFAIQPPSGRGLCPHGAVFSYRNGGNKPNDPARLLVDEVVKIDDNHMLGRALAKFGPIRIPIAYFVLEREERDLNGHLPIHPLAPVRMW